MDFSMLLAAVSRVSIYNPQSYQHEVRMVVINLFSLYFHPRSTNRRLPQNIIYICIPNIFQVADKVFYFIFILQMRDSYLQIFLFHFHVLCLFRSQFEFFPSHHNFHSRIYSLDDVIILQLDFIFCYFQGAAGRLSQNACRHSTFSANIYSSPESRAGIFDRWWVVLWLVTRRDSDVVRGFPICLSVHVHERQLSTVLIIGWIKWTQVALILARKKQPVICTES